MTGNEVTEQRYSARQLRLAVSAAGDNQRCKSIKIVIGNVLLFLFGMIQAGVSYVF
jgi:hypothetical protein